ncbi:arginyltransferase [Enterovibrio paralichthyis]|uniref:arginyltransferase n=1 Tax=Enterovibrio paralichthyis TaxID=2853805 RepID=UPI001C436B55|nr:arginyltransferase [Enterovibrio paralichthyis]MBV7297610.1 arginyltransferase [Enterovibrio paralichthyis]
MTSRPIKFGIMAPSNCSYLPGQQESVAVLLEPDMHSEEGYNLLIQSGFRRSGNNIYRPHCLACTACQSLRINVAEFAPSKSQKRHISQLKRLHTVISDQLDDNWFALYEHYISVRHRNGSMYPANKNDFLSFVQSRWQRSLYLHLYENGQLIAIAVTDVLDNGLSAIYSFFDPEHPWSLGSLCVLAQIRLAQDYQLPWLYLGFQIDECSAMNYKRKFNPHQRYVAGEWCNGD